MTPQQVGRWLTSDGRLTACEVSGPLQSRENSRLFYARCAGAPGPMAVKIFLRPRTAAADPEAARRQYDTLMRVHGAMGSHGELAVPRPYILFGDVGLVGTEWVTGQSMTALLFSWRCSAPAASSLVVRAARWLRRFHDCHALPPARLDVEEKLAFLATLEAPAGICRFFPILERAARAARSASMPASWVHGDFTADNLMLAGNRTLGLDIDGRYENTVVHDLAPFLNYLELRAFHPQGWRRLASFKALGATFLKTYFDAPAGQIAVPLAWLRLYLLLQGWNTAKARSTSVARRSFLNLSYGSVASRVARVLEAG